MRFIKRVHTLVGWAPGRWKDIDLAPRTVVVGANGKGKSRLATSLSLLVSGRAPGEVFGKEDPVAAAADLAELYPAGVPEVFGYDQDGIRFAPPAARTASQWAHPIRAVSTALRGSAETASTFFAPFLVSGTTVDIAGRVPETLKATAVGWKLEIPTTVTGLQTSISTAKETIRALGKRIEGAETVLAQVPANDTTVSRALELQALVGVYERQSAEFVVIETRAAAWEQWCAQRDRITAEEKRLTAPPQVPDYTGEISRLQAYRASGEPGLVEARRVLGQGNDWAEAERVRLLEQWDANETDPMLVYARELVALGRVAPHSPGCPGCGGTGLGDRPEWISRAQGFLDQQIARTQAVRDQVTAEREKLPERITGALAPYIAKVEAFLTEFERVDGEIKRLHAESTGTSEILASYNAQRLKLEQDKVWFAQQPIPPEAHRDDATVAKRQEVQANIRQARDQYNLELKRQGAAEQVAQARRLISETQAQRGWFVGWLDALQQIHAWLVEDGIGQFQTRVQAYLPAEFQFRILLERESGGKAGGIFRFGLADGETVHSITYGAGRALVLYAIACACLDLLPQNERPGSPILLLDEERSIDSEHLVKLMKALSGSAYQVVVTSTHLPATGVDGWGIVDLSALTDDGVPVIALGPPKRGRGKGKRKPEEPLLIVSENGGGAVAIPTIPISDEELDAMIPLMPGEA